MTNSSSAQSFVSLFQQGRHHELIAIGDKLGLSSDANPLDSQVLAASYFQIGQYSKAAEILDSLQSVFEDDGSYLSLYGATCRRLGLTQKAEELLRRALEVSSGSPDVRNNYANLLIDLGRLSEASTILQDLLADNPEYQDAQVNLNRLRFREQAKDESRNISDASSTFSKSAWMADDPLMMAFSEQEVEIGKANPKNSSKDQGIINSLPNADTNVIASEQLKMANQANQEGNPSFALDLCSQAHLTLGANPSVYVCASDSYVKSKNFSEAEICLLHSIVLGSPTISNLINLVSFSSLRGDLSLAFHYLDQAAGLDPTHPHLRSVRSNLERIQKSKSINKYHFDSRWKTPDVTENEILQ